MAKNIQALRGMKDIMPKDTPIWLYVEGVITTILHSYGYCQIRTPLVEQTAVFSRAIGTLTDIVAKEMYSWQDNNGDMLSLRPEGTASCVRAMIEHNSLRGSTQKLYYNGSMFRHERPQKGRYRQFNQTGVEIFGIKDAKADAELIAINHKIWQKLALKNLKLEINSLGSQESRTKYKKILTNYFNDNKNQLDDDSKNRLNTNPLRILDSKNPDLTEIITNAPKITQHLDIESNEHFSELQQYLDALKITYTINPTLVRGLDYYNKTVFEWISADLGAQGTISAGGRYDGLVEQMGGKSSPAAGFAIGMERLILLIEQNNNYQNNNKSIYLITSGKQAQTISLTLANIIRDAIPALVVYNNLENVSLKSQFKKADKLSADFAIIIAEDEIKSNSLTLKPLKTRDEQTTQTTEQTISILKKYYK